MGISVGQLSPEQLWDISQPPARGAPLSAGSQRGAGHWGEVSQPREEQPAWCNSPLSQTPPRGTPDSPGKLGEEELGSSTRGRSKAPPLLPPHPGNN